MYLQLEIIWDECFTDSEVRAALEQLPKGLDETYQHCMKRIEDTKDIRPIKALKWIGYATRPLHIGELMEAVAFDLQDTAWDREKIPTADFVTSSCANLAVLDLNDHCVYFAHGSVKQYLEKYTAHRIPGYPSGSLQGELECGEFCVAYLSFSNFGLEVGKHDTMVVDFPDPTTLIAQSVVPPRLSKLFLRGSLPRKSSYPRKIRIIRKVLQPDHSQYQFLDYAISNWPLQTKKISQESTVWEKFEQLALRFSESWNFHPWIPSGRSQRSHLHGLFGWAVTEQHQPLLSIALNMKQDLQDVCNLPYVGEGLPALHIASRLGYDGVVEVLLDVCNINLQDEDGDTPLHHAANKGHVKVTQLLLNAKGSKVDIQSKSQYTPLSWAASNGHEAVVKLLVDRGANLELEDRAGLTPLLWAAKIGHEAVVKVLVDRGANLEVKDRAGQTPLLRAAEMGHEAVVKLLVDRGANLEAEDDRRRTPLSWAAIKGHEAVVKLLVDRGANLEAEDDRGRTPRSWLVSNGHEAVVR